jgi:hypothetical protein
MKGKFTGSAKIRNVKIDLLETYDYLIVIMSKANYLKLHLKRDSSLRSE